MYTRLISSLVKWNWDKLEPVRRRRETGKQLMIPKIPHHPSVEAMLWHGLVWLPVEQTLWCLLMMWPADTSSRVNCECTGPHSLLTFSQMKLTRQSFTVQMDNNPKHTANQPKSFSRQNRIPTDLNPTRHAFLLVNTKRMNADGANLMLVFGVQLAQLLYTWYYSVIKNTGN